jgi:hypothetical protein
VVHEDEIIQSLGEEIVSSPQLQQQNSKYVLALGLDVGTKRIGVAGCDRTGLIELRRLNAASLNGMLNKFAS